MWVWVVGVDTLDDVDTDDDVEIELDVDTLEIKGKIITTPSPKKYLFFFSTNQLFLSIYSV